MHGRMINYRTLCVSHVMRSVLTLLKHFWNSGGAFFASFKPGFHSNAIACVRALRALRKRKPQETQALALARNKRKRQPIGMLGRSSDNHDWLLANAIACVSCGFRLRNARNASDCFWMETGLYAAACCRRRVGRTIDMRHWGSMGSLLHVRLTAVVFNDE